MRLKHPQIIVRVKCLCQIFAVKNIREEKIVPFFSQDSLLKTFPLLFVLFPGLIDLTQMSNLYIKSHHLHSS